MKLAARVPAIRLGLLLVALGGCSDIFADHERLCKSEARTIVHDPALWEEYLTAAEQAYSERAKDFPDTERVVAEYAPEFEHKFGSGLTDAPSTMDGEVVREDLFIVKDGALVAQFVNFYARRDFAGRTVAACFARFPELYGMPPDRAAE